MSDYSVLALGVGNGADETLGCAAFVIERDGAPLLLMDCGYGVVNRYRRVYDAWPHAVYVSHCHLDHVADLERLFIAAALGLCPRPRIYVHASQSERLLRIFDNFPGQMAEGGVNFFEAMQLVPVLSGFWCDGELFAIHPVPHHRIDFCHALALPGSLFVSADSRPMESQLERLAPPPMLIFHDVSLVANPSHAGAREVAGYAASIQARMRVYHYADSSQVAALEALQLKPLRVGERLPLPSPQAAPWQPG